MSGLITKEQALELLDAKSDMSPAAKLQMILELLDPTYSLSKEEKELDALRRVVEAAAKLIEWGRESDAMVCAHPLQDAYDAAVAAWKELDEAHGQAELGAAK